MSEVENTASEPTPCETRHELSSHWTLWTQIVTGTGNRKAPPPLGPVFDFSTVEEFWAIYNSLKAPSSLQGRVDLLFFRSEPAEEEGKFNRIHPEWEDTNNEQGGEYRAKIEGDNQDKQWESTLLAILGGSLEMSEDIAGIWLGCGRKAGNTLCLWKKSPDDETSPDSVQKIGDAWTKMLKDEKVPLQHEVTYIPHSLALKAATDKSVTCAPTNTWKP